MYGLFLCMQFTGVCQAQYIGAFKSVLACESAYHQVANDPKKKPDARGRYAMEDGVWLQCLLCQDGDCSIDNPLPGNRD